MEGSHRSLLQPVHMFRVLQSIGNSGENVRSVVYLTTDQLLLPGNCPGIQIHKPHNNSGGAIVHRQTVVPASGIPRLHRHNHPVPIASHQGHGDLKVPFPARRIQASQHRQGKGYGFVAQLLQRQPDTLFIAAALVFRRWIQAETDLFTESLHAEPLLFCDQNITNGTVLP